MQPHAKGAARDSDSLNTHLKEGNGTELCIRGCPQSWSESPCVKCVRVWRGLGWVGGGSLKLQMDGLLGSPGLGDWWRAAQVRQLIAQLPLMAVVRGWDPKGTCSVGSQWLLYISLDQLQKSPGSEESQGPPGREQECLQWVGEGEGEGSWRSSP